MLKIRIMNVSDKGYEINETIKVSDIQPVDVESLPIEFIQVDGVMKKIGKNFLFRGKISGYFTHVCDRCLDDMRYELDREILWLFERGLCDMYLNVIVDDNRDDGKSKKTKEEFDELAGKRTFQGEEIDLTPYIWEELVLDMPYKFLCRKDCAGLCPKCGANLNHISCSCNVDKENEPIHLENTKLSELLQGINLNIEEK
ncbi:MAG TPA: DUF177 domain-containing protein [Candidatus Hydrogenedens sp.]|nr:DUF177 domain-containing protein [Candidatus Hydrogenedens sp.]